MYFSSIQVARALVLVSQCGHHLLFLDFSFRLQALLQMLRSPYMRSTLLFSVRRRPRLQLQFLIARAVFVFLPRRHGNGHRVLGSAEYPTPPTTHPRLQTLQQRRGISSVLLIQNESIYAAQGDTPVSICSSSPARFFPHAAQLIAGSTRVW